MPITATIPEVAVAPVELSAINVGKMAVLPVGAAVLGRVREAHCLVWALPAASFNGGMAAPFACDEVSAIKIRSGECRVALWL